MKIVYRKFGAALIAVLLLGLAACGGGEMPAEEAPPAPVTLAELRLECSAPRAGADFPAAARAFAGALQAALTVESVTVETLQVSFSRADAATAQALAEGGVDAAVLSPLAALREEAVRPVALLRREGDAACGVLAAADSAYGAQLIARAVGASPISGAEWSRAVVGVAEGDTMLFAAADYALWESAGCGLSDLPLLRRFDTVEALLLAAEKGELDALLLRQSDADGYAALLTVEPLCEAVFAASPELTVSEETLLAALRAALETAAGQELLRQYDCGTVAAAENETVETLRRLAEWEGIQ